MATNLNGREKLFTSYDEITKDNVVEVLESVKSSYLKNQKDIQYLQKYRKGEQPILHRTKKIRPDINNKVVKNRANEIINFKTGYLLGEPIQYISRDIDTTKTDELKQLNNYMYMLKKANVDKMIAESMYVCGTAYRMTIANVEYDENLGNAPFEIFSLDPSYNSVVYHTGLGNKPLMCFSEITFIDEDDKEKQKFCIYTKNEYFEVVDDIIVLNTTHTYEQLPMIEYCSNETRLGAFEVVITILDAINNITSNRIDGVEQFVQSLMKFINVQLDKEKIELLNELGAIMLTSREGTSGKQDVEFLTAELNQTQVQTLIDSLDKDVLILCGMPNRNGGNSTSDTGSAVIMRDGWSDAEARAKEDELMFKASEIDFLKLVFKILENIKGNNLKISDIDIRFTRKNYENIMQKSSVLLQLLSNEMIHPRLAFAYCGMFTDSEVAYAMSLEHYNSKKDKIINIENNDLEINDNEKEIQTEPTTNRVDRINSQ